MNNSKDEHLAAKEWKEYYKAIKEYELDKMEDDPWHQDNIGYLYDGFFTGFYAARDIYKKEG